MLVFDRTGGGEMEGVLSNTKIRLAVAPQQGMTVQRLEAYGKTLVSVDSERKLAGKTYGISLLYPTPNRVRDGRVRWGNGLETEGRTHGFARFAPFEIMKAKDELWGGRIEGRLVVPSELCPIRHEFRVTLTLRENELVWCYEVFNNDTRPFPFGFGLHPFFNDLDGRASVCVNGAGVMRRDSRGDFMGEFVEMKLDKAQGVFMRIADVTLNDAYRTGTNAAEIHVNGLTLKLTASEEFAYTVVYTPGGGVFCIENQTCAPDAHYLYSIGLREAAALQWVGPGKSRTGHVCYRIVED